MSTNITTRSIINGALAALSIIAIVSTDLAHGAEEPLKDSFSVWTDLATATAIVGRWDFDVNTDGREITVFGAMVKTLAPNVNNKVKGRLKLKMKVKSPDGSVAIGSLSKTVVVTSLPYPDPGNPLFQNGGPNVTTYMLEDDESSQYVASGNAEQERETVLDLFENRFGLGIATGAGMRTLIIGASIQGVYINNLDGYVDIDTNVINAYDADSLNFLCRLVFHDTGSPWYLESTRAAVADFLPGARNGSDEIRIVQTKEIEEGPDKRRFSFYDPRTCTLLQRVVLAEPS